MLMRLQWLWFKVFENSWDTTKPVPTFPPVPPVKHQDLAIAVGWLDQDLPPSTCASRRSKAKDKAAKKALGKGKAAEQFVEAVPKVALHRRRGQPAYLRARMLPAGDDIEWFWTDGHAKGLDPAFVNLEDIDTGIKVDMATVQAWALDVHDHVVQNRAHQCNLEKTVYWMRCRLVRHVGALAGGHRPSNPTALDFATLDTTKLLWPLAIAHPKLSDALKANQPK